MRLVITEKPSVAQAVSAVLGARERKDGCLVGINATRLFSCLYGVALNVGRVQTPTLAMLVSREAEIGAFVKEPFYTPEMKAFL